LQGGAALRSSIDVRNWTRDSEKEMALLCEGEERPLKVFWKNREPQALR
jgi:hypothetical protein